MDLEGGQHRVVWDGRDRSGEMVPPGVYMYRLAAGTSMLTGKVVRVK
jgi:hypothetical protein